MNECPMMMLGFYCKSSRFDRNCLMLSNEGLPCSDKRPNADKVAIQEFLKGQYYATLIFWESGFSNLASLGSCLAAQTFLNELIVVIEAETKRLEG